MNPAALKANIVDLPAGGALIVNTDAFTGPNLQKVGYAENPLTDGSLELVHRLRDPDLDPQRAGARGPRHDDEADRPDEELLRPRDHVLALRAEHGSDPPLDRREVRQAAGDRRGERPRAQGRLRLRRDDRDLPYPLPGRAGPPRPGHLPQHHRQRGDRARLRGRRRTRPSGPCSTAPTRSPRPATSSTSCRATSSSG